MSLPIGEYQPHTQTPDIRPALRMVNDAVILSEIPEGLELSRPTSGTARHKIEALAKQAHAALPTTEYAAESETKQLSMRQHAVRLMLQGSGVMAHDPAQDVAFESAYPAADDAASRISDTTVGELWDEYALHPAVLAIDSYRTKSLNNREVADRLSGAVTILLHRFEAPPED